PRQSAACRSQCEPAGKCSSRREPALLWNPATDKHHASLQPAGGAGAENDCPVSSHPADAIGTAAQRVCRTVTCYCSGFEPRGDPIRWVQADGSKWLSQRRGQTERTFNHSAWRARNDGSPSPVRNSSTLKPRSV